LTPTETKNDCTREIAVEIPAAVVARETEAILQKYQKMARIPGFRKGKVPASIVRQRFAADLRSDVIEALVPKHFREEVEKQGLHPVSQPRVKDLEMNEGQPLRFKASFEVLPEIAVAGYQEVRAEKADTAVSDEEVGKALNNLREQRATFTDIEGSALADGDFAVVSFTGTPQGEENAQPASMDEVLVEIGGANTLPEFTENLRGARAGDERSFDVHYPADFSDERLAGKHFSYRVTVKGMKQKNLPELDDDFAKGIGAEFQTVDALRTYVRERLEHDKRHQAEHEAKDKIVDQLLQQNEFPVPEALVERQIDLRLERGLRALAAQGMSAEQMRRMDLDRLRAGQRDQAVREVRAALILDKIADAEKIEVTDADLDAEIAALARQTQQSEESVRARLTRDGALDRIRGRIRNEKTLEHLYRKSA
jgi:trigger factor